MKLLRILARIARFVAVAVLPFGAFCCVGPVESGSSNSKYGPAFQSSPPRLEARAPLAPLVQDEPHTCGLLAISAIYNAYGQDPEAHDLRFRLGTDRAAVLGKGPRDSMGTLHPDICRVLEQDGWLVEIVPGLPFEERVDELRSHLASAPALALIARGPTNAMHWIALDSKSRGMVRVVDSLQVEVLELPIENWLNERVLSLLLLSPQESREQGTMDAHKAGTVEMLRVVKRLKAL